MWGICDAYVEAILRMNTVLGRSIIKYRRKVKIMLNSKLTLLIRNHINGFSLVELVTVMAIFAVLTAIIIPIYSGYVKKTQKLVCETNIVQLENKYEVYLALENVDHSKELFSQYIQIYGTNICPVDGNIDYWEGQISCSVHHRVNKKEIQNNDDYEEVPFF